MTRFRTSIALLLTGLLFTFASCSTSSEPGDGNATIQMTSEMEGGTVTSSTISGKGGIVQAGAEADSVRITRVRILLSNLKMHHSESDSMNSGTVKTGPFLVQFDSAGTRVFANASVPAGSYDRIKFEIHKLSSNEVANYLNDTLFADFVTNDRYTVIIEGMVWTNGVGVPFVYRSKITENIQVRFSPAITLEGGTTSVIALKFAPRDVFKKGSNRPLDPRDQSNHNEFDKAIKDALKANKKS